MLGAWYLHRWCGEENRQGRQEAELNNNRQLHLFEFVEHESGRMRSCSASTMCKGRGAHWLGMPALTRAAAMAAGRPSGPSCWLPPENCSRAIVVGRQGAK
jgi:hypothetical protein